MVSSSQEASISLYIESLNISYDTFTINKHIIIDAIGSSIGNFILAPNIPIKLPTEDKASDLWCHASAFNAPEFIFMAADLVYQMCIRDRAKSA